MPLLERIRFDKYGYDILRPTNLLTFRALERYTDVTYRIDVREYLVRRNRTHILVSSDYLLRVR